MPMCKSSNHISLHHMIENSNFVGHYHINGLQLFYTIIQNPYFEGRFFSLLKMKSNGYEKKSKQHIKKSLSNFKS